MTDGAWVTLAVSIASTGGVIITALIKLPARKNGNGQTMQSAAPDPDRCPGHSGLVAKIQGLKEGQDRIERGNNVIWNAVDEMRNELREMMKP